MIQPAHHDDDLITVTDGSEVLQIQPADLADAQADGFYCPADRGMTVVGNGTHVFEVPLTQVKSASSAGFRDLLRHEPRPRTANRAGNTVPSFDYSVGSDSTQDEPIVIAELNEVESRVAAAEEEREQEIAETTGWRRWVLVTKYWLDERRAILVRQLGSSGISVLIHVAILLLLASLVYVTEEPEELLLTASSRTTDSIVEEIVIDPSPLDLTEPTDEAESEAAPESEAVAVEVPVTVPNFMGAVSGDAVKPPAAPSKDPGKEGKDKPSKKPTFFGSSMAAINYVFVIDNSNSMTRGRFETAIHELMLTVNRLTPKQRFYVIFYSDTAYPMLHPYPATQLVPATKANKAKLWNWLLTVQLCLRTNGKEAIQAAFDLEPDVIYILGDGAFTDRAGDYFAARPHPRIIVHTRGMEVTPKNAIGFRKLAEANRGTYMDVGVNPQGALMAKQSPVRRNNTRGPVWGVKLPLAKKP